MALFTANPLTTCLYTTVRNMDSVAHYYGFLPPHGRRLDSCEEMSFWGNLWDRFHKLTPQERFRRSFEGTLMCSIRPQSAQPPARRSRRPRIPRTAGSPAAASAVRAWECSGRIVLGPWEPD